MTDYRGVLDYRDVGLERFQCTIKSHPKTAYSCKKSARPSKAELTATKSNDIKMRPCARCASCKININ